MKKKTSPNAGPTRRPRTRPAGSSAASAKPSSSTARPTPAARKKERSHAPVTPKAPERSAKRRMRQYLTVAILPNGTAVLIAIILALILLVLTSTTLAALPATIAQIWLVANMVPVKGGDITIGLLPMAPAMLLGWAVAKRVRKHVGDSVSLRTLGGIVAACLGVPVLLSLTASAMLLDASQVFDLAPPSLFAAIGMTLLVHACAVVAGMGTRLWRAMAKHVGVPAEFIDHANAIAALLRRLLMLGTLMALVSLAVHFQAVGTSLSPYRTSGIIAMIALGLLYLPNVAVMSLGMLLGADIQISDLSVSLFDAQLPVLPPMPWFAALPQHAHATLPLLMALPALVMLRFNITKLASWRQLAANTAFIGAGSMILAIFAGGELGYFLYVGPTIWLLTLLAMAWYAATGAATLGVATLLARRVAPAAEPDPEPAVEKPAEPEEESESEEDDAAEDADILEGELVEEPEASTDEAAEADADQEDEAAGEEADAEVAEEDLETQAPDEGESQAPEKP